MKVVSTMGSGTLGREVDLKAVVEEIEELRGTPIDANFTKDGMVTFRLEEDGPAYTLYRTGTFQIRGAETKENLNKALNRIIELLSDIGLTIRECDFRHVTSVFMEDIEQELNLEALTISLGMEFTEYEPEQFPGLIYRPRGFDATLLVFSNGKVSIGGTTEQEIAKSAISDLEEHIADLA